MKLVSRKCHNGSEFGEAICDLVWLLKSARNERQTAAAECRCGPMFGTRAQLLCQLIGATHGLW